MILNQQQKEKLLKGLYIGQCGAVDFQKANGLYNDIMLITASCGRGKTTYALSLAEHGLLDDINRKRNRNSFSISVEPIRAEEVLFLTSRKAVKEQQLANTAETIRATQADFQKGFDFDREQKKGKIKIATAHQFGAWVRQGYIDIVPKVVILDELHSIISESFFADDLVYTMEYLKEHYFDIIKIGLTATPQFLLDYIKDDQLHFSIVDQELGAKYKCDKIKAYIGGKGKTILEQIKPRINQQNKVLFYTQSATQCYKLAKEYGERAAFLISDYNETEKDGKKLVEIMQEQGVKEKLLATAQFPKDIDIVFINSACREGMNLKDDNIKIVICEAVDMITIEQILGRIRNDLEEFIVIANFNNAEIVNKNIEDFIEFIKQYETAENPIGVMYERLGRQKENKNLPKFVYSYKGELKINKYIQAYLQYVQESYIQLKNNKNSCVEKIGDRELKLKEEYLQQLAKYAKEGKVEFEQFQKAIVAENHNNSIEQFQKTEEQWINKPLTKADKEKLCADMAIIRSNAKIAKWNTIKALLQNNGYTITESKRLIDGERKNISIIEKSVKEI